MSTEINADALMKTAIENGLREGVKNALSRDYDNPMKKMIEGCIESHRGEFTTLLNESLSSCLTDPTFRADIAQATRTTLAKTLVQKFGGELEKQVNTLKSDPATRARITLAIEEIVKSKV